MTDATSTEFLETKLTNSKRKFAICNVLLATLFAAGNALIPSLFWQVGPDSSYMPLSVFASGVLAMQIALMGIYGGLYDQFILVRLTWATIGVTAFTLFFILGIQIADHSLTKTKLDVQLAVIVSSIAFGCFLAMIAVSLAARKLWHYRLVHGDQTENSTSNSFGIAFLMKLTAGIACLMLGIKMLSFESSTINLPILAISAVVVLTFILVSGLIASSLKTTLANEGNANGLRAILLIMLVGTPTLVLLCRLFTPNSWSFLGQLLGYGSFLAGFTSSLTIVLLGWRKLGVTLARVSKGDL